MSGFSENTLEHAFRDAEFGGLISRVSVELAEIADHCADLQETLSRILDIAAHPELEKEFHILQKLDLIEQTLKDLTSLHGAIAQMGSNQSSVDFSALPNQLTLDSVKAKLFPHLNNVALNSEDPNEPITWF